MTILPKRTARKIVIGILLLVFYSCQYTNQLSSDKNITEKIEVKLKSEFIDLSDLNDFEWDSLLILGAYSDIEKIEKELNLDLGNIKENEIKYSDSINLIIFLKNGRSVKISQLSRNAGDFTNLEQIIKKNEAKYIKPKKGKNILMNTKIDVLGIPANAFWAGKENKGNWFDIEFINRERNMAKISIYDEKTGRLIIEKTFMKICTVNNLNFIENLKDEINYFDGEKIQLKDSCFLMQK